MYTTLSACLDSLISNVLDTIGDSIVNIGKHDIADLPTVSELRVAVAVGTTSIVRLDAMSTEMELPKLDSLALPQVSDN